MHQIYWGGVVCEFLRRKSVVEDHSAKCINLRWSSSTFKGEQLVPAKKNRNASTYVTPRFLAAFPSCNLNATKKNTVYIT